MVLGKDLEHKSYEEWLSLGKTSLRGGLITVYNSMKGDCSQVGISLFSQTASDRTRGCSLTLHQGNFFTERVTTYCNGLSRDVGKSPGNI